MSEIALRFTTGDERVDRALRDLVAGYEAAYPGRIAGYYLSGSHADGSAAPASNVDVISVWYGSALPQYEPAVMQEWYERHALRYYLRSLTETNLLCEGNFVLREASVPLFGRDIRAALPPTSPERYLRGRSHVPLNHAENFRQRERFDFPLSYPAPDNPFYGYVQEDDAFPLREIVAAACWNAALLLTLATGEMARTKAESVRRYREAIGGEWWPYVEALYTLGKERWNYALPGGDDDRRVLRELCRRFLAFENHYFTRYRDYLLAELRGEDRAGQSAAALQLARVAYRDDEMVGTLAALVERERGGLRAELSDALTLARDGASD